jgi:hypothetical protein
MLFIKDNKIVEHPGTFTVERYVTVEVTVPSYIDVNTGDHTDTEILVPEHTTQGSIIQEFELPYNELTEGEIQILGYTLAPDQPEYDPVWQTCLWENNAWVVKSSEAAIQRDNAWTNILEVRQELLDSTDYIVNEYSTMSEEDVQAWKDYRQALRDITQYKTGEIDDWMTAVIPDSPDTAAYKENINER